MTQRDKLIARIVALPPEADFSDVQRLLELFGWTLARQTSSHTIWKKAGQYPMSIPLTQGGRKVKRHYLNLICEQLGLDAEAE